MRCAQEGFWHFLVLGAALSLVSACQIAPATPTPKPALTATVTVMIPLTALLPPLPAAPTATATLEPAVSPTPPLPPQVLDLVLGDDFSTNERGWALGAAHGGTIALSDGRLVFALSAQTSSLVTLLPSAVPADGYVAVTALTLLCDAPKNEFGLVLRAERERQYRIGFACDGSVRFERYLGPGLEGASAWQPTPSLLPGAPAENRIAVVFRGSQFTAYANGTPVLSYTEPLIEAGQIGLFARTERSTLLTLAFDDLEIRTLAPSAP
jgi:hypothetical protein